MDTPPNYHFAFRQYLNLNPQEFPNLIEDQNFKFTSLRSDRIHFVAQNYNCCAWALGRTDRVLEMSEGFLQELDLDEDRLDHSVNGYAKDVYPRYGFATCDNGTLEPGFEKIALYGNQLGFSHVARQLDDGSWTSKLGDWEDISHNTPEDLSGEFYGLPMVYMKRPITLTD